MKPQMGAGEHGFGEAGYANCANRRELILKFVSIGGIRVKASPDLVGDEVTSLNSKRLIRDSSRRLLQPLK